MEQIADLANVRLKQASETKAPKVQALVILKTHLSLLKHFGIVSQSPWDMEGQY